MAVRGVLGELAVAQAWVTREKLEQMAEAIVAKIVLNHIGGALGVGPYADKRKEVFADWSTQIAKLGQFPNVYIKLGGLGMPSLSGFGYDRHRETKSAENLRTESET